MIRVLALVMAATWAIAAPAWAANAATSCEAAATLNAANNECETDGDSYSQAVATAPAGTVYDVRIKCVSGAGDAVCNNPITCDVPPGSVRYDVLQSTDHGQTFVKVSEACLTNPPEGGPPVITPAMVAAQFQALSWPESPLTVQPPGGRTLVNFETNFFTTNTAPTSQAVTLLGQQVEIEATPSGWTWRHGDGTDQSSTEPGAAYPDLAITHTYLDADVTVAVSVDTTYSGRYRVNGGPWIAIPATVTVAGAEAGLEVVPAKPQLVAAE